MLCTIFVGIQSFGPAFAAIIITSYYEGKEGLKKFAKRLIKFKVKYLSLKKKLFLMKYQQLPTMKILLARISYLRSK